MKFEPNIIFQGNCLSVLKSWPDNSVQCTVTSPPYWGLRVYDTAPEIWGGDPDCRHDWVEHFEPPRGGKNHPDRPANVQANQVMHETDLRGVGIKSNFCSECQAWKGELGLEPTPDLYVQHLADIFSEVRRVLKPDGTLWLNLGDSFMGSGGPGSQYDNKSTHSFKGEFKKYLNPNRKSSDLKPKDLVGIPWRVAFALQASGWYLRSDIIWNKPNAMPESVTDRPTRAHEYIFLLSKSRRYYYDADAIKEPLKDASILRLSQDIENQQGSFRLPGKTNGAMKAVGPKIRGNKSEQYGNPTYSGKEWNPRMGGGGTSFNGHSGYKKADGTLICNGMANKKSVWTITTQGFKEAHFATYPEQLVATCIKAGSREGDVILDPFAGSGTTLQVAKRYKRNWVGIELNPEYIRLGQKRLLEEHEPLLVES